MNVAPEIRREKIFIPSEMSTQEISEKYGLPKERAWKVKRQGFFVLSLLQAEDRTIS